MSITKEVIELYLDAELRHSSTVAWISFTLAVMHCIVVCSLIDNNLKHLKTFVLSMSLLCTSFTAFIIHAHKASDLHKSSVFRQHYAVDHVEEIAEFQKTCSPADIKKKRLELQQLEQVKKILDQEK